MDELLRQKLLEHRDDRDRNLVKQNYLDEIPNAEGNNGHVSSTENLSTYSSMSDENSELNCTWEKVVYYILCFGLWASIYSIFIKLEFGAIYFIISILVMIYLNTSTRRKKEGEISAYSVFNKNCESIEGTLKAEQFEKELYFGSR